MSIDRSHSTDRQKRLRKRLHEERMHALIEAVPQSDRGPDGMPTREAVRAIVETIAATLSPEEVREVAKEQIVRMAEVFFELMVKMGAAERVGEGRYRKLREPTAAEHAELDAALNQAFEGAGVEAVSAVTEEAKRALG